MALIGDTSELDTLLYGGKYMLPEAASYTMTTPWGVVSSDAPGGFVRQQLQFFNSPAQVQVVYRCVTKARVDYLKAFIRIHEGLPFIAALAVDTDEVEPYVVDVVGAPTWQENGFSGTCTLTYQVQPTPNAEYDEFLQWSGATLGDGLSEFANWIAKTANEDLPDTKQMPIDATGTTASFINGLYYDNVTPVDFSDLVTFSRLSAGSYIDTDGVLKTAAIGEPRFEAGGLLIEGQSTNLFIYSKSPNSYQWSKNDDNTSYIKITDGVRITGTGYYSYRQLPVIAGQKYTFSVTCKALSGTLDKVGLEGDVFLALGSGLTPEDGTVRLSGTVTPNVNGYATFVYYPTQNSVVEFTDIQFEALPYATSFITTDGAAATRASDSAAVDMQPHAVGTIFAEFLSDAVAIDRVVYTAGAITLKRLAAGAISVTTGAVTVTSAVVPSGSVKTAISYDGNTLKLAVNGIVYSAASALPSAGISIALGNTTFANVWQRSEAYDNARLIEVTQ